MIRSRIQEMQRRLPIIAFLNAFCCLLQENMIIDPQPGARCILRTELRRTKRRIESDSRQKMLQTAPGKLSAIPKIRTIAKLPELPWQRGRQRAIPELLVFIELQIRIINAEQQTDQRRLLYHAC